MQVPYPRSYQRKHFNSLACNRNVSSEDCPQSSLSQLGDQDLAESSRVKTQVLK